MNILTVANHKGGVGKSATVQALGVSLAQAGRRVLMVDTDPQSSLTGACGVKDASGRSLAEVLGGAQPGHLQLGDILVTLDDTLTLAPSDIALATVELALTSRMGREVVLKKALATVAGDFDVCLIDTPPSLGLLTVNALTAADAVLIPTQPQIVDLRGLALFMGTLSTVQEALNPGLQVLGILPTFFDSRLVHHQEAIEAMQRGALPLLDVTIGRSVRVAESAANGETVLTYDPSNKRAAEYRALGKAVERWLNDAQA